MLFVLRNKPLHSGYLSSAKTSAMLQSDRIQPEVGYFIISFKMNVTRLILITCIKEESV